MLSTEQEKQERRKHERRQDAVMLCLFLILLALIGVVMRFSFSIFDIEAHIVEVRDIENRILEVEKEMGRGYGKVLDILAGRLKADGASSDILKALPNPAVNQ